MININVGIKGTSSHETSHISTSEICEFRVHSTPPRFKMNNIVLQSKITNNGTKNISFSFPLVRVNFSLHSNEIKHTGTNVRFPVSLGTRAPSLKSCSWWTSWSGLGSTGNSSFGLLRKGHGHGGHVGNVHGMSGISAADISASCQKCGFESD